MTLPEEGLAIKLAVRKTFPGPLRLVELLVTFGNAGEETSCAARPANVMLTPSTITSNPGAVRVFLQHALFGDNRSAIILSFRFPKIPDNLLPSLRLALMMVLPFQCVC